MDINEYQAQALETAQFDSESDTAISISLLGLAGEVGELSTEYKKQLRDGEKYKIFREKVIEEMGDIIWYLSIIASHENVQLSEILSTNLKKINNRWTTYSDTNEHEFFDDGFPQEEQFPREFVIDFQEWIDENQKKVVSIFVNGVKFGNDVRDNIRNRDFYRFHDIFHFSYVAVLGWSPVVRRILKLKRKGDAIYDEVEDGGRSWVIDEAVAAIVFAYARDHDFLDGVKTIDYELLRSIKQLTSHLEVKICTERQWEQAILLGFKVWHQLKNNGGGKVVCDMHEKDLRFEPD